MQDLNPKAQVVVLLDVTTMKTATRMRKTITITIIMKDLVQVMVQKRKRKRNSIANPMCQISIDLKKLEKKVNFRVTKKTRPKLGSGYLSQIGQWIFVPNWAVDT